MSAGSSWRTTTLVAAGGAIGAAARYGLSTAWPTPPESLPAGTLAINVVGCLAIGLLLGVDRGAVARAFIGTGVLGGFTTFSTYTVQTTSLWWADRPWAAAGYVVVTLVCALAATRLGLLLVRRRR